AAEGFDPPLIQEEIVSFRLANAMTPLEAACAAADGSVDLSTQAELSWYVEGFRALAWALGLELALPPPWMMRKVRASPLLDGSLTRAPSKRSSQRLLRGRRRSSSPRRICRASAPKVDQFRSLTKPWRHGSPF